jgi:hypothetical protein
VLLSTPRAKKSISLTGDPIDRKLQLTSEHATIEQIPARRLPVDAPRKTKDRIYGNCPHNPERCGTRLQGSGVAGARFCLLVLSISSSISRLPLRRGVRRKADRADRHANSAITTRAAIAAGEDFLGDARMVCNAAAVDLCAVARTIRVLAARPREMRAVSS